MVSQVKAEDGIQLLQTYTGSGWLEVCLQRLQTVANGLRYKSASICKATKICSEL